MNKNEYILVSIFQLSEAEHQQPRCKSEIRFSDLLLPDKFCLGPQKGYSHPWGLVCCHKPNLSSCSWAGDLAGGLVVVMSQMWHWELWGFSTAVLKYYSIGLHLHFFFFNIYSEPNSAGMVSKSLPGNINHDLCQMTTFISKGNCRTWNVSVTLRSLG